MNLTGEAKLKDRRHSLCKRTFPSISSGAASHSSSQVTRKLPTVRNLLGRVTQRLKIRRRLELPAPDSVPGWSVTRHGAAAREAAHRARRTARKTLRDAPNTKVPNTTRQT